MQYHFGAGSGIHHVTSIAGEPQKNIDFYATILGLRLVKKTANFDDPYTYHFYFGNAAGMPGSIITFFPWSINGLRGRRGNGQLTSTSFSIPAPAIDFWVERLAARHIPVRGPFARFDEQVLLFEDPDVLEIELIGTDGDSRDGWAVEWLPGENNTAIIWR